ncbi:hypothetical protein [Rufibacter sp. LB8]|uniref:hypothetical protein n=1 Tax=Rufibacter sp. LB8 TaxID=2777781 RepID=UPI00178C4599|nr:hypothetical protein [Rufibacter sp. LB8]
MPAPKMEVRQFVSDSNNTYLIYRYKDDANNNYEYQVYQLVQGKESARYLGAPERIPGRESDLNTREMCDWIFKYK